MVLLVGVGVLEAAFVVELVLFAVGVGDHQAHNVLYMVDTDNMWADLRLPQKGNQPKRKHLLILQINLPLGEQQPLILLNRLIVLLHIAIKQPPQILLIIRNRRNRLLHNQLLIRLIHRQYPRIDHLIILVCFARLSK